MHVSAAVIEDRHRIARALRDTVAPTIMTLGMHVVWARGVVSDPKIVSRLAETELLARETRDAIGSPSSSCPASTRFPPPPRRKPASDRERISGRGSRGVALRRGHSARDAPAEIERELALLAHEGLRNVHSHTRAARAVIRLTFGRATMRLSNLDDGMGVPTALGPCIGPARRRRDGNQCGLAFLESAVAAMGVRMSVSEARMGGACAFHSVGPTTEWL
jgi:signal transduction histidine kinase